MYRKIDGEQILLGKLRDEVAAVGTQQSWALRAGVPRQAVNDVMRGRRQIGEKIARALGYRRVLLFERLPEPERVPDPLPVNETPTVSFLLIEALLELPEYEIP